MLGAIVNAIAIFIGAAIGLIFGKGIPERVNQTVIHGIGLAIILIGLMGAMEATNILLVIISLVLGGIAGEIINIELRLDNFGKKLEARFANSKSDIAKAFVMYSLMTCVGSMGIIGALEGGLTGNHTTLFAKSVIDFILALVFAASMGFGVLLSGFSVLIYEGSIAGFAFLLKDILVGDVVTDMSSVGGLLIAALGFKLIFKMDMKVGNLLPAIFVPIIYYSIINLF